jgi:hypothetical protein
MMNGETRLSEALKLSPAVLEYVISLNPHDFARLRNPLMQKVMPPRITLKRIAAMVKMPTQELLDKLNDIAGLPRELVDQTEVPNTSAIEAPSWFNTVNESEILWIDVLRGDVKLEDPMPPINIAVNALKPGEVIGVKHKWEPQPLFDIWDARGFDYWSRQMGEDEWHIFVHKPEV